MPVRFSHVLFARRVFYLSNFLMGCGPEFTLALLFVKKLLPRIKIIAYSTALRNQLEPSFANRKMVLARELLGFSPLGLYT